MTATTFDPSVKTNTTLSGGNLIATSTGLGGARSSRVLQGPSYFEMTLTTLTGAPMMGVATSNWTTGTSLSVNTNAIGYLPSGVVSANSVTLATIAAYVQGNRIDCAIDPANHLIWFRVANGNWNNNVANNPTTGVGGIDYTTALSALGTLEAAVYASLTGNVWTAAFSAGSFAGTPPTGFVSLDNVQYTVAYNMDILYDVTPVSAPSFSLAARAMPSPLDRYQHLFYPAGAITNVSGTTKEAGVAVAGRKVEVYDRITGDLLGFTLSDGSGNWSIPCLGRPAVRVVGSDPTTYNSVVYDNVVPV